jgi:hypothetical protein
MGPMPSPAGPYKTAQEAALRASADLQAAMGGSVRIYTEVPAGAVLPYIVLGNDQIILETSPGCADEAEVVSTVTWWSRLSTLDKGVQARAMGSAIVDALNMELTVAGWDVVEWQSQSEHYLTDPDQSTKGIAVIRHLLTEQVA